ncbi:MAG: beta-propeller fold lactonase family protein [Bdellovibrio sp.]|nr:beta-propeller fold lactonase family protein [Bdellovibrio sp.]
MKKNLKVLTFASITAISVILSFTQCAKNFDSESFAPAEFKAKIKGATANGGGALYCSISGGCPLTVTGTNFYAGAKVYVGPYECLESSVNGDNTQISCKVGPGKSGVFDISVRNRDGNGSIIDPSVSDPTTLQFSYASFLYLANQSNPGRVYGYAQNPTTGALLNMGAGAGFATTGSTSYGIVLHPNNKYIYTADYGSGGTISFFSINPLNGFLTLAATYPNPSASGPAFHPSGKFLYVANVQTNNVSAYAVADDGTLSTIVGAPFASGVSTTELNSSVIDPTGKFLYVSNSSTSGGGGVIGYAIDQTTGALSLIPGSPFKNILGSPVTPSTGDGITIHPNGRWLFIGGIRQKKVISYEIDTTTGALSGLEIPVSNGNLTDYGTSPFAWGGSGVSISPDGRFLFGTAGSPSTADKFVTAYTIDLTTGFVSRVSNTSPTGQYFTNGSPNDIKVDSNGAFAYTCNPYNNASIDAYRINSSTGQLTHLTPSSYAIPIVGSGPGTMVIQK